MREITLDLWVQRGCVDAELTIKEKVRTFKLRLGRNAQSCNRIVDGLGATITDSIVEHYNPETLLTISVNGDEVIIEDVDFINDVTDDLIFGRENLIDLLLSELLFKLVMKCTKFMALK